MFCRKIPPISSMQCGTVRDRLHEPFYGMFPGKKLRITEEFEKVLSLLKAESMQSRELGIALAKSRLGLDSYDLVHRIKKLCLYHKEFNVKGFVSSLNVLEELNSGKKVSSIRKEYLTPENCINPKLVETMVLHFYDPSVAYDNLDFSKIYISKKEAKIIENVIRNQKGDFYTSFLLYFVY